MTNTGCCISTPATFSSVSAITTLRTKTATRFYIVEFRKIIYSTQWII